MAGCVAGALLVTALDVVVVADVDVALSWEPLQPLTRSPTVVSSRTAARLRVRALNIATTVGERAASSRSPRRRPCPSPRRHPRPSFAGVSRIH